MKTKFPKIIRGCTPDIKLIKLEPTRKNAKLLFDMVDFNRKHLEKYLDWVDNVKKPADELKQLKKWYEDSNAGYIIKYKEIVVGTCGFHTIDQKSKSGEIGYWLDEHFTGLGIMTNAVKTLEEIALIKWDFNRIVICMDPRNKKSKAVAVRLGYHLDGTLRQSSIDRDGKFVSVHIYSKLKSEYRN